MRATWQWLSARIKPGLERTKKATDGRLKLLNESQQKLNQLRAGQPPDEAAIEAQKAKVDDTRDSWARKKQKEWQEAVDELCLRSTDG
ncbi:hypothetical protein ACIP39_12105 [Streptomyces tibetensis]|uniref:hypothetical protein n=1 Tax=Streptomyces tibetensis TaxID=2382123 RepID=UPI0038295B7F